MKRYGAILFMLLLVVPTLLAGMALYRWLLLEQDRIERAAVTAAGDQARAVADNLQWTVADLQTELTQRLAALDPTRLPDELREWERRNPLIRRAFIWREDSGLRYPDPGRFTEDERRFAARYAPLFAGRDAWNAPEPDAPAAAAEGASPRREIRRLLPAPDAVPGHWLPWFEANQLFLLGWTAAPDGTRYGVELETMALISRLAAWMPDALPPGRALALLDAGGQVIFQRGDAEIRPDLPRLATVQLAPALPHWEVAVFQTGPGLAGSGRRLGRMLLAMLAGSFILVPLTGGTLLLRQARRDARDARRKTTFVSNVSHELKTPLTTIRMYAEMLAEDRVPDAARRTAYLATIVRESQRLTRLVNNVLDFSRLEQGRKKYAPQHFPAAEVAAALLSEQAPRLEQTGLALETDLQDSGTVFMDRDAFEQVLLNLLDNAIKYAGGGGKLSVVLADRAIRVRDQGPGIPAPLQAKVFDRFVRGDDSLTTGQPGSGLGLTIARRLMRDQGGDVILEPAATGACFVIQLPGKAG